MLQLIIVALVILMLIALLIAPQYKHYALFAIIVAIVTAHTTEQSNTNAFSWRGYKHFAENHTERVESDNQLAKALAYTFTNKGQLDHFEAILSEVSPEEFIAAMHSQVVFKFHLYGEDMFYPIELLMWDVQEQAGQLNEAYGYIDTDDLERQLDDYYNRMHHFFKVYFDKLRETGLTPPLTSRGRAYFHKMLKRASQNIDSMMKGAPKSWQMQNLTYNPFRIVIDMYNNYVTNPTPVRQSKRGRDDDAEADEDFDSMLEDITTDVSKKMRLG